jgi:hypothetical protein
MILGHGRSTAKAHGPEFQKFFASFFSKKKRLLLLYNHGISASVTSA